MAQAITNQNFIIGTTPSQTAVDHISILLADDSVPPKAPFILEENEGLRIYKKLVGGAEVLLASGDVPAGASPARTWRITGLINIEQTPPIAQTPEIEIVSPSEVSASDEIFIQGTGFSTILLNNVVEIDGEPADVVSASALELSAIVPASVSAGANKLVTVVVSGTAAIVEDLDFARIDMLGPNLSDAASLDPDTASVSEEITLRGAEFTTNPVDVTVTFTGGATAVVVSASKNAIVVEVPPTAQNGTITLAVGVNSDVSAASFTRTDHTVVGISVPNGPVGTVITIAGTGFSTYPAQNAVSFNGTAATPSAATGTQLTVTVPPGATSGVVSVTIGAVVVNGPGFTVDP